MRRTNHSKIRRFGVCIGVGLLTGLLMSCGGDNEAPSDADSDPANGATVTGQNLACNTPTYTAEITWSDGEPQLTFASTNETELNQVSPVAILNNDDGSRTYGYRDDRAIFTRFYLDGTCLIQAFDDEENVTVEAFGQTRAIPSEGDASGAAGEDTTREADTTAATNGNEPIAVVPSPEASPDTSPVPNPEASPEVGPEAGNDNELITAAPAPDTLSLQCSGVIQDEVDFTAYFNNEVGFSRVEFSPRTSDAETPLTSTLSYTGKNSAGQSLWRGSVSAMADVTLVHLSTAAAKPGDRVSVGYDGRWGQAICQ